MTDFIIVEGVLRRYLGDDRQVKVPKGVREIGYRAFCDVKNTQSIILPQGLKKINFQAFVDCDSLKEMIFPDSLESVGRGGFKNIPWLDYDIEGAVYAGHALLFVKDYLEEIVVKEGTKIICADAFRYCMDLKKVVLPKGVERVEHRAFQNCFRLKHLVLPETVSYLGDSVFKDCRGLELVIESRELKIGKECFPDDTKIHLRNMLPQELPIYLQAGAILAFAEDMEQQVVFRDEFLIKMKRYFLCKRKQLYPMAVKDKNLLRLILNWEIVPAEEIDILLEEILSSGDSETVATLLRYKEEHADDISLDLFDDLSLDWDLTKDEKSEKDLRQEWGIKENVNGTLTLLRYYGRDEYVVIPARIGMQEVDEIFADACSPKRYGLGSKSIQQLNRIRKVTIEEGITKIGRNAFAYCRNLEEVVLPKSILEIGDGAFFGCEKLVSVAMSHRADKIGENAFPKNKALVEKMEGNEK